MDGTNEAVGWSVHSWAGTWWEVVLHFGDAYATEYFASYDERHWSPTAFLQPGFHRVLEIAMSDPRRSMALELLCPKTRAMLDRNDAMIHGRGEEFPMLGAIRPATADMGSWGIVGEKVATPDSDRPPSMDPTLFASAILGLVVVASETEEEIHTQFDDLVVKWAELGALDDLDQSMLARLERSTAPGRAVIEVLDVAVRLAGF